MPEYDFSLILSNRDNYTEDDVEKLAEAGCDDGTIAQRYGRVYVTFSRTADNLTDAVISAVLGVKHALNDDILRVDMCNLVTQAEIARRINKTRSLVGQYISGQRGPGSFPPAACNICEGQPLWYWCEVAYWLSQNDMIADSVNREALEIAAINTILELAYLKEIAPEGTNEIIRQMQS